MQRFSLLGAALLCSITVSAADCNRACLKDTMTKYLAALVAQDPSKAPLASNLRFTEDSKDLKAGEGLWKLATKLGDYRQDFIDVKQQVVLSHVIVEESGKPAFFTARLKISNGKITEAETLVTHPTERMAVGWVTRVSASVILPFEILRRAVKNAGLPLSSTMTCDSTTCCFTSMKS